MPKDPAAQTRSEWKPGQTPLARLQSQKRQMNRCRLTAGALTSNTWWSHYRPCSRRLKLHLALPSSRRGRSQHSSPTTEVQRSDRSHHYQYRAAHICAVLTCPCLGTDSTDRATDPSSSQSYFLIRGRREQLRLKHVPCHASALSCFLVGQYEEPHDPYQHISAGRQRHPASANPPEPIAVNIDVRLRLTSTLGSRSG